MMKDEIAIKSALVSVYYKNGLDRIIRLLHKNQVQIYSTGGTEKFIQDLGVPVTSVEDLTDYPSILGGRVKTLHPKVFGGILNRREEKSDQEELEKYHIPLIDLVIVNLYPFEETLASGASDEDIIEKIDIGGISLIRAGGKNFADVCIIPSPKEYALLEEILDHQKGVSTLDQRRKLAGNAFKVSSSYDYAIAQYFNQDKSAQNIQLGDASTLRYGENPHQKGYFFGDFSDLFEKLHGKELSYNNLVDLDAGILLMDEFSDPSFLILKHNNACGFASRPTLLESYESALACDPVSAFGGVLFSNRKIDLKTAEEIHKLFFEVLVAPEYDPEALSLLEQKKNRIILIRKNIPLPNFHVKTLLNGYIGQDMDKSMETEGTWKLATHKGLETNEKRDLSFALKIVKHTKSNAIILAKNHQMVGIGLGQTSRVDALNQAIAKAEHFGFDIQGSVMASDAFFPFPDCVEIAAKAGISAIIQPGGSIKDQDSIDACNAHNMAMVFTSIRHFKH